MGGAVPGTEGGAGYPAGAGEAIAADPAAPAGGAPAADALEFRRLDPAFVPCDRIGAFVLTGVLAAAGVAGAAGAVALHRLPAALAGGLLGAFVALDTGLLVLLLRWTALAYERTRYRLDGQGLHVHRGVLWRDQVTVPRSRVQHTDVTQGPIQRRFGLATLTVHTAASELAAVTLSGLAHGAALALRDELVAAVAARPPFRAEV